MAPEFLAFWLPQGLNDSIRCSGDALIAPTVLTDQWTKPPARNDPSGFEPPYPDLAIPSQASNQLMGSNR